MYITEDKNKSDGRTIKNKTKKLLLDTFGNDDAKIPEYTEDVNSWYFDVFVPEKEEQNNRVIPIPSIIALSKDGYNLDDSLRSHSLSQNIIDALNRAGIYGDVEIQEAMWEVVDSQRKSKKDIIESMEREGFVYSPGLFE
jgi:hypothetical protein